MTKMTTRKAAYTVTDRVYKKDGESFAVGDAVLLNQREPVYGIVAGFDSLLLYVRIVSGVLPNAKPISRNITRYGWTDDKGMVALW